MNRVLYSSSKMNWRTPEFLFQALNQEYHFVLDAAADPENKKCKKYYTETEDGLKQSWDVGGAVFCNPPYGRKIWKWVKKAYEESQRCKNAIVLLIPARTDTTYFHEYVYGKSEIRFIRGRLRFLDERGKEQGPAPFPSMVVVYNGERKRRETDG